MPDTNPCPLCSNRRPLWRAELIQCLVTPCGYIFTSANSESPPPVSPGGPSGGLNSYNAWDDEEAYVITEERLNEIRGDMMYPFTDPNDYQKDINDLTPQIDKKLNVRFPYYGFLFNYTWVSDAVLSKDGR